MLIHKMKNAKTVLATLAIILAITSCKKKDGSLCIENRIDIFELEACETGASVKQYAFQNETVYALQPGNCIADGSDEVLDADCTTIGFVGGFGGTTDVNGENFYNNAVLEETIWSN